MGSNNASSGDGSNRYEPPKKNIVQKIFEASPTVKVVKAITKNANASLLLMDVSISPTLFHQ